MAFVEPPETLTRDAKYFHRCVVSALAPERNREKCYPWIDDEGYHFTVNFPEWRDSDFDEETNTFTPEGYDICDLKLFDICVPLDLLPEHLIDFRYQVWFRCYFFDDIFPGEEELDWARHMYFYLVALVCTEIMTWMHGCPYELAKFACYMRSLSEEKRTINFPRAILNGVCETLCQEWEMNIDDFTEENLEHYEACVVDFILKFGDFERGSIEDFKGASIYPPIVDGMELEC